VTADAKPELEAADIVAEMDSRSDHDRQTVRIGPALSDGVTTVVRSDISLSVGVGEGADDQLLLVPFLNFGLFGANDQDAPVWIGRLPLDNVAFLLEQVAVGLAAALDPLASMTLGELKPSARRLDYAADRTASAGETLREAAAKLRELSARKI
jgi:hypothetical protein